MRSLLLLLLALAAVGVPLLTLLRVPAVEADKGAPAGKVVLVVHGGEGDLPPKVPPEMERDVRRTMEKALRAGYQALRADKGTSLDAVEAAIRVLEDSPLFNAGKGAVFTREGRNELDAAIMEGKELRAGAVAGVTRTKNPISLARAVMEKSPHVLLAGEPADRFAARVGLEQVNPLYYWTEHRWKELQDELRKEKEKGRGEAGRSRRALGTVGAVALDAAGNLAAGTSTGGLTAKWSGRIGDSPIVGAGTYADNESCAVSCTGVGEFFIRYTVSADIAARMKYKGLPVERAVDEVVRGKLKKANVEGGAIALDARGRFAVARNAEQMTRGYVTEDGKVSVAVVEDALPEPK
jgi:beta-aspartyl-peptidase (threonine type)